MNNKPSVERLKELVAKMRCMTGPEADKFVFAHQLIGLEKELSNQGGIVFVPVMDKVSPAKDKSPEDCFCIVCCRKSEEAEVSHAIYGIRIAEFTGNMDDGEDSMFTQEVYYLFKTFTKFMATHFGVGNIKPDIRIKEIPDEANN